MKVAAQLFQVTGVFDVSSHTVCKKAENEIKKKERRYLMTNYTKMTLLSAALAAFLLPATAQTSSEPATPSTPATVAGPPATAGTPSPTPHQQGPENAKRIQDRKVDQQDRIANGVSNGSLTAGEASTLENKESQINHEEQSMKAADNGHLTKADRIKLQQQQNQLSNQIYQDKHNAATQYVGSQKAGQRGENQQDRIAQGLKSGQLTAGEATHLEGEEAAINQEKRADRAANGGHLTAQEKAQINRQQNKVSHQIYKDKHNNRAR
jgi:hypothetical protein